MMVYFVDLDDYGKGVNIETTMEKYRLYFDKLYTVDQIINAIHEHCGKKSKIPKVCDLEPILNPQPAVVTESQYIEAQKAQEKNGYPAYSPEAMTIQEYKRQKDAMHSKPVEGLKRIETDAKPKEQHVQGRTCTDPHGKEKARIIVEGLKRGIGPQQALAEGGF
jgi:hypothetical protein